MFVFKIVPFLNPDGVYNGCYRTDTLGQNLNRVYLAPTLDKQPSIYAVQKLIRSENGDSFVAFLAQNFQDKFSRQILFTDITMIKLPMKIHLVCKLRNLKV